MTEEEIISHLKKRFSTIKPFNTGPRGRDWGKISIFKSGYEEGFRDAHKITSKDVPLPKTNIMINRKQFFDSIRTSLFGSLTGSQVIGLEDILTEWELWVNSGWVDNDLRKLAYICATSYHETGAKMQPVEEIGRGKKHAYGKIDPKTGKAYYGRGDVQLTWDYNYKKMGKLLGLDLYNNPDLALDSKNSKAIMFEGMLTGKSFAGDFTGKHLGNYFNKTTNDPIGARRIINGTDRAKLIAGIYEKFLKALTS